MSENFPNIGDIGQLASLSLESLFSVLGIIREILIDKYLPIGEAEETVKPGMLTHSVWLSSRLRATSLRYSVVWYIICATVARETPKQKLKYKWLYVAIVQPPTQLKSASARGYYNELPCFPIAIC